MSNKSLESLTSSFRSVLSDVRGFVSRDKSQLPSYVHRTHIIEELRRLLLAKNKVSFMELRLIQGALKMEVKTHHDSLSWKIHAV